MGLVEETDGGLLVFFDKEKYKEDVADPEYMEAKKLYSEGKWDQALEHAIESYNNDNMLGELLYGTMILEDAEDEDDIEMARGLFVDVAENGNPLGALKLARLDLEDAHRFEDEEDAEAAFMEGIVLYQDAEASLKEMCEAGSPEAQKLCETDKAYLLGMYYLHAKGEEQDLKKAEQMFLHAASEGDLDALLRITDLYGDDDLELEMDQDRFVLFLAVAAERVQNAWEIHINGKLGKADQEKLAVLHDRMAAIFSSMDEEEFLQEIFDNYCQSLAYGNLEAAREVADLHFNRSLESDYLEYDDDALRHLQEMIETARKGEAG